MGAPGAPGYLKGVAATAAAVGGTGDVDILSFSGVEYIIPIAHCFLSADIESRRPEEGSSFAFSSGLAFKRAFGMAGRVNGDVVEDGFAESATGFADSFGSPYRLGAAKEQFRLKNQSINQSITGSMDRSMESSGEINQSINHLWCYLQELFPVDWQPC
jgi:hypothetical protein